MTRTLNILILFLSTLATMNSLQAQWVQTNGPYGGVINSMVASNQFLFAGTNSGLYRSNDNGISWDNVIIFDAIYPPLNIYSLTMSDSAVVASTNMGIYFSSNGGETWGPYFGSINYRYPFQLSALSGNNLAYAAGGSIGVVGLDSTFHDVTTFGSYLLPALPMGVQHVVQSIAFKGNIVVVGSNHGIYESLDTGKTWVAADSGLTSEDVNAVAIGGNKMFAGTDSAGVFCSTDSGRSWSQFNLGLTTQAIRMLAVHGDSVFAGANGGGIFFSNLNGPNWNPLNPGWSNPVVNCLIFNGETAIAGTDGSGIFEFSGTWTPMNSGLLATATTSFASIGGNLFAGSHGGGVFLSTDNGSSWNSVNSGLTNLYVNALLVRGDTLYAGTYGGGVFLSTSSGQSWTPVNSGITEKYISSLAASNGFILAGTILPPTAPSIFLSPAQVAAWADSGIVYISHDGNTWSVLDSGYLTVQAVAVVDTNIFVAGSLGVDRYAASGGLKTVVNSGLPSNASIYAFAVNGNTLYAGMRQGEYLTTNQGANWTPLNFPTTQPNTVISAFAPDTNALFCSTTVTFPNETEATNGGVFVSLDNGDDWKSGNAILARPTTSSMVCVVNHLFPFGTNLYAGTNGFGVWEGNIYQMIADDAVKTTKSELPTEFSLLQNYPNPFNPETIINYQLPANTLVTLKVFDELGRLVRTLIDDRQSAGTHSITFNASNLATGVYFYRLIAGSYAQTKKLMLLK